MSLTILAHHLKNLDSSRIRAAFSDIISSIFDTELFAAFSFKKADVQKYLSYYFWLYFL